MTAQSASRTLFFFEKPSAMRQLQRFFKSPSTICVSAEGHLLAAEEPGSIREEWKPWRFDALPIVLERIPVTYGTNRSGQSHKPKIEAIKQALKGVERVIIATDPGREGSMIAWEVLEHLGYRGRVDRLKLGALDEVSIRRAFAVMAKEPDSGERDYAAYLEALCRQYEDYHLGLNGTRAMSLRLRPPAFREPWRFGGVQTPTLAILADLEQRIRDFVPQDYFKIALKVMADSGAEITLWHAPKDKILDKQFAETIQQAAISWSGPLGVEQKDVRRSPPRLFSKDTLARRCAKRFGWDPQHTAKLAQDLYDQGYLTYPRTESEHLPESQTGDARAVIGSVVGILTDLASFIPAEADLVFRKGNKGHYVKDPGEHHAIVPLRKVPQPGSIGSDHLRLWELVAKSFLAAHLPDGIDARTTVVVQVPTPHGPKRFSISGSVIKSPGWRAVYGAEADEDTEAVPGKAKAEEEPTTGRLPPVQDNEPGKATDARIETAKTEPPRRITRGELPVVMGRLVDQVEDPTLKAALENPANPNEPKGLGTAATRDTILPKLQKSRYVELLKGKDPPIQVTEIGLAFIAAVRRVFPNYGDPVGRAMFEADLAEIGRATTREEAIRRAAAYQERTRSRVQELIGAVAQSQTVAVDPTTFPASTAPVGKPPTKAMIAFATALAARKGVKLPRGLKSNSAICRAFLDQHAPARSSEPVEHRPRNGPRPPSEAMVRYARALAEEHGMECPPEITTDFAACRAFLDAHASRRAARSEDTNGATIRKSRSPATASAGHGDSRGKTPAAKRSPAAKAGSTRGRTRAHPANSAPPTR
ncbi:DNA topoisomerase [Microvirga sp. KLBC 81]|uniref:type IA DNA topoisomerase n=1 Tax=Microvirga sp. KLBC 81 TaxID=1862707 RepID=UPI000D511E61|nr:DNA topoisomerase [Microvirga sp. KLBC 81]PVE24907.1 DNA topoisomerase [Microvirga sp. KLBC 81]